MTGYSVFDEGWPIISRIRRAGFTLTLDENKRPRVSPTARLTEGQRELLRANRELIEMALWEEKYGEEDAAIIAAWFDEQEKSRIDVFVSKHSS